MIYESVVFLFFKFDSRIVLHFDVRIRSNHFSKYRFDWFVLIDSWVVRSLYRHVLILRAASIDWLTRIIFPSSLLLSSPCILLGYHHHHGLQRQYHRCLFFRDQVERCALIKLDVPSSSYSPSTCFPITDYFCDRIIQSHSIVFPFWIASSTRLHAIKFNIWFTYW